MFMLGFAWQAGTVPLPRRAIERAIALNDVAVERNKAAFSWGRRAAVEPEAVIAIADRQRDSRRDTKTVPSLNASVARRVNFLAAYQDVQYGARFGRAVSRIREAEEGVAPGQSALGEAVAVNLFKLMAIKDEYEVARLFTDGSFRRQLMREFSGWQRLEFHLAPPLVGERDLHTGHLRKRAYGPWMMSVFKLLAMAKGLRGTRLDVFGYSEERKRERRLLGEYEETLESIVAGLSPENYQRAILLARWPDSVRGFGHVKEAAIVGARVEAGRRQEEFLSESAPVAEAAE